MKRSAFTLVELLVVIAVIAILVAILIPAVNAAREHARRAQCITNQRSLAIAMVAYDGENNGLPGYLNQLGETSLRSWVVSILPMIGENKRYEFMMRFPSVVAEVDQAIVPLPAVLCPSDKPSEVARLNYVANCGPVAWDGVDGSIAPLFTLFKDRRGVLDASLPQVALTSINKKVKIDEIPDGTSNTILLTENVDNVVDNVWCVDHLKLAPALFFPDELPTSAGVPTRSKLAVAYVGFLWANDAAYVPNSPTKGPRPSSRHPGTVVAAFADGAARPINDNIDIWDWLRFVCPDDVKARKPIIDGGLNIPL